MRESPWPEDVANAPSPEGRPSVISNANNTAALRAAILARHPSVYAFCKAHAGTIGKSVVVLLLAGRYPGNVQRQTARLWGLLQPVADAGADARPFPDLPRETVLHTLEGIACKHCTRKRKRKDCRSCRQVWREQADALRTLLENRTPFCN